MLHLQFIATSKQYHSQIFTDTRRCLFLGLIYFPFTQITEDSKPKCDTSGENIMKNTAGLPSGWGA